VRFKVLFFMKAEVLEGETLEHVDPLDTFDSL
jgi:hypothetical protein